MKKFLIAVLMLATLSLRLPSPVQASAACDAVKPVDTQFRVSSNSDQPWVNGGTMSKAKLAAGTQIDVNCFAKNGGAIMTNALITLTDANGTKSTVSSGPELRNWTLPAVSGKYTFTCSLPEDKNCYNTDSFTISVKNNPTPQPTASVKPTAQPTVKPTPAPTSRPATSNISSCDDLTVASGNNSTVPAKVILRAKARDNQGSIQKYKYYFGDGQQVETDAIEVEHKYESSGTFVARVDIKDSRGVWKTSNACETNVSVKKSAVESHKSDCSDLFITEGNHNQAPATLKFKLTGYDNKGDLKRYKLDFGNGIVKESDGQTFEQRYDRAGTYTVKGYILDTKDSWKGGDDSCQQTVYVGTQPLTRQPQTGLETWYTASSLSAGLLALLTYGLKKKA